MAPRSQGRRRGAQPGNTNALKHGFYSAHFKASELRDLDAIMSEGLSDEISALRVFTRRIIELANGVESLDEMINVTGALGLSAIRLAGLLKAQKLLTGEDNAGVTAAISQALTDDCNELGITKG